MKQTQRLKASLSWILAVISLIILLFGLWLQSNNASLLIQNFVITIGTSLLVASLTSGLLPYVLPTFDKETLLKQLNLFYPSKLLDEVLEQVLDLSLIRESSDWKLQFSSSQPDIINVNVAYNYVLSSTSLSTEHTSVVYHLPNTLLQGSKVLGVEVNSITFDKVLIDVKANELRNYLSRDPYGIFLHLPLSIKPRESIRILLNSLEIHPSKSEIILISYIPSLNFKVRVEIDENLADKLEIRAEYYHPSKKDNSPTYVGVLGNNQGTFCEFLIDKPCLRYQGVRIGWQTDRSATP